MAVQLTLQHTISRGHEIVYIEGVVAYGQYGSLKECVYIATLWVVHGFQISFSWGHGVCSF